MSKTWVDAINFVGDQVLGATKVVGNTIGDAALSAVGVDVKALYESSKPKYERKETVQNIEIVFECPYDICERCGECGREDFEDLEDIEDFEQ